MPTEDNSHTRRIARVRQIAEWKGLNKVVGALSGGTQLSMKMGGVVNIQKNFNGIGKTINNSVTFTNNNESFIIPTFFKDIFGSYISILDDINCDSSGCNFTRLVEDTIIRSPYVPITLGTFTSGFESYTLLYNNLGRAITVSGSITTINNDDYTDNVEDPLNNIPRGDNYGVPSQNNISTIINLWTLGTNEVILWGDTSNIINYSITFAVITDDTEPIVFKSIFGDEIQRINGLITYPISLGTRITTSSFENDVILHNQLGSAINVQVSTDSDVITWILGINEAMILLKTYKFNSVLFYYPK